MLIIMMIKTMLLLLLLLMMMMMMMMMMLMMMMIITTTTAALKMIFRFSLSSIHPLIHSPTLHKNTATHPLWADGPFLPQVQQLGPQVVWAGTGRGSGPARDRGGGVTPYREVMVSSSIVPGVVHTLSVAAGCTEDQQPLVACVGVVCMEPEEES